MALRPDAREPNLYRDEEKSIKKYILETQFFLSKGNLKKAKETIDYVLSKGYEHSDAYFLSGEIDRQLNVIERAESKFLKALTFQVYTPKVYFSLGLIYNYRQEYDKSIRWFKKFLFTVETPEGHFQLGKALMATNNPSEAAIHFSRAIVLDPEEPAYYLERAQSYQVQGLEELAQEDYVNILKIDPLFPCDKLNSLRDSDIIMDDLNASKRRDALSRILA